MTINDKDKVENKIKMKALFRTIQFSKPIFTQVRAASYQTPLKYPVPQLNSTLEKYLKSVKPFLTPEELEKSEKIVKEFGAPGGEGEKLNELLLQRASKMDNWLQEWWVKTAYLEYRDPVVVYSSPGLIFPRQTFKSIDDRLVFSAKMVAGALDYKNLIDNDQIPQEMFGKSPLDMSQYKQVFGTTRIPCIPQDVLTYHPKSEHIIVISNNYFFKLNVKKNGSWLKYNQLLCSLQDIFNKTCKITAKPIGLLTTDNRDNWANSYTALKKLPENNVALEAIKESLFTLCLDAKEPFKCKNDLTTTGMQLVHGGGPKYNAANRWYDKTIQFVVSSDGGNGLTYEHSPAEGQPIAVMMDYLVKYFENAPTGDDKTQSTYQQLEFKTNSEIEVMIKRADSNLTKLVNDLEFNCYSFNDFGKDEIKNLKVSPDSFLQMAMQYAFYKIHCVPGAHYESGSTRMFIGGRTETIRSCSVESITFAKTMLDKSASNGDKAKTLRAAIQAHKDYTISALNAQGVDRHLLGLRLIAKENGKPIPKLFDDKAFKSSTHMRISTSQLNKQKETALKEKENMVMKFAISEKDLLNHKKEKENLNKKLKDAIKENENLLIKLKNLSGEKAKISQLLDTKSMELSNLYSEVDKLKDDINARDIKIKWTQNKLKSQLEAAQGAPEQIEKLNSLMVNLQSEIYALKEENDELREHLQAAEHGRITDQKYKEQKAQLIMSTHEYKELETKYRLLSQKLDQLMEENSVLIVQAQESEQERYEINEKLKMVVDQNARLSNAVVELEDNLEQMDNMKKELKKTKEVNKQYSAELESLRKANEELETDMELCKNREAELLEFTQKVTDKNVSLQSEFSSVEASEVLKLLKLLKTEVSRLESELKAEQERRNNEANLLARQVAEKSSKMQCLESTLTEAQSELTLLKNKYSVALKELQKELQNYRKKAEQLESNGGGASSGSDSMCQESRTSSLSSLNDNSNQSSSFQMGVSGLTTYIKHNSSAYFDTISLKNSVLVIDGNSLVMTVIRPISNYMTSGGDYDLIGWKIEEIFNSFVLCGIVPIVIFDGAGEKKKYETILKRVIERVTSYERITPEFHNRYKPLLLKIAVRERLMNLGVTILQSDMEADREIAAVAKKLNAPVLSDDSDFYIYDVPFIPLETFSFQISDGGIQCSISYSEKFLQISHLNKEVVPLLSVLAGNDYTSSFCIFTKTLEQMYNPCNSKAAQKIVNILNFLKSETYESAVNKILNAFTQPEEKTKMKTLIENIVESYTNLDTILTDYIPKNITKEYEEPLAADFSKLKISQEPEIIFNQFVPDWVLKQSRIGNFHNSMLTLINLKEYMADPQIEDYTLPGSAIVSLPIITLLAGILLDEKEFIFWNRSNSNKYECSTIKITKNFTLESINELSFSQKQNYFLKLFNVNNNFLQELPEEWVLYFCALKFWAETTNSSAKQYHIHSLLLMLVVVESMEKIIGRFWSDSFMEINNKIIESLKPNAKKNTEMKNSVKQALQNIDKNDCFLMVKSLLPYFELNQLHQKHLIHSFSEFQNCLFATIMLNQILAMPFESPKISKFYNSTFLYNMALKLKSVNEHVDFISNIFNSQGSVTLTNLYLSLVNNVLPYFNI